MELKVRTIKHSIGIMITKALNFFDRTMQASHSLSIIQSCAASTGKQHVQYIIYPTYIVYNYIIYIYLYHNAWAFPLMW